MAADITTEEGESETVARVRATDDALAFLDEIVGDVGPVMFHQSGGCCDGSSPMCYPKGEFRVGSNDVQLGTVKDADVWISGSQFEVWKHTQLILDVVPGQGGMFSLDNGRGRRFITRSRVFSDDELDTLNTG
ncbi:MAG: DUF779 domain-containing protein [Pseudomonadota bacterium]